ncbi:lasso RiPP family leader peptide-containing protein [Streptomyces sp. Rer75]|nr:lasso RiPP family leader peptide-containing protein [Streptomyces sp. Rer75]QLH23269.1 lasso RiPP family leader peptide-containing protein [Streptomyces sp. Rer75]
MHQETAVYEPAVIEEIGDFAEVTLGGEGHGWDAVQECAMFC